jgi:hypothetical protein
LLSQEAVRGTPAITIDKDHALALWQNAAVAETRIRELGKAGTTLSLAANAELPAGALANGKLFVAYIAKQSEKRSVWLVEANR